MGSAIGGSVTRLAVDALPKELRWCAEIISRWTFTRSAPHDPPSFISFIFTALPGPIMVWGGISFGGGEWWVYAGIGWLIMLAVFWWPAIKAWLYK